MSGWMIPKPVRKLKSPTEAIYPPRMCAVCISRSGARQQAHVSNHCNSNERLAMQARCGDGGGCAIFLQPCGTLSVQAPKSQPIRDLSSACGRTHAHLSKCGQMCETEPMHVLCVLGTCNPKQSLENVSTHLT